MSLQKLLVRATVLKLVADSYTADLQKLRESMERLREIASRMGARDVESQATLILEALEGEAEAARREYFRLFELGETPPYETAYTCRMNPHRAQFERADIAGFYKAFGVKPSKELPDHIAAELEFLSLLHLKEANAIKEGRKEEAEICREARKKFLKQHLTWIPQLHETLKQKSKTKLYPQLTNLTQTIITHLLKE